MFITLKLTECMYMLDITLKLWMKYFTLHVESMSLLEMAISKG